MVHDPNRKMSIEEAKRRLMNPPPEVYRRPVLKRNAPWMVMAAVIGGFFMGSPARLLALGALGYRIFASPVARKALLPLIVSAAARRR